MEYSEGGVKSSNITEIVHKFARVCRLRSIGVFSEENNHNHRLTGLEPPTSASEAESEATVTDDCNEIKAQKIHPQPSEDEKPQKPKKTFKPQQPQAEERTEALETLISKLFANISALKAAYVQLQAAHTPYDPDKIQSADRAVIDELKNLSELKHSYREKEKPLQQNYAQDSHLLAEIQEQQSMLKTYEVMVKKFQAQIQSRDAELERFREDLREANEKRERLEKKLRQKSLTDDSGGGHQNLGCLDSSFLTPQFFISVVQAAAKAAHDFAKLMINMMKAAEWDLDAAANSIEPGVRYAKRAHKKYAFESYVCQRIFGGFENESFYVTDSIPAVVDPERQRLELMAQFQDIQSRDPFDLLAVSPDCLFGKFCHTKYLHIVHPKMEESFFGNPDQRNHVLNGGHPRTPFYQSFLKLAKAVWLVHRLAFSFDPRVNIFQVRKGTDFSEVYMESIVKNVELADDVVGLRPKVGFTVMPGFRIGKTVIQCQVYLTGMKSIDSPN
uniref:Uncharacterized protein n=1 Tax=Araucaria cunninghamii TaxID=56994 RepID=A0A0D6R6Z7_ARACU